MTHGIQAAWALATAQADVAPLDPALSALLLGVLAAWMVGLPLVARALADTLPGRLRLAGCIGAALGLGGVAAVLPVTVWWRHAHGFAGLLALLPLAAAVGAWTARGITTSIRS